MALRNLDELIQLLRQTGVVARQRAAAGLHPAAVAAAEGNGTGGATPRVRQSVAQPAAPGGLPGLDALSAKAAALGTRTNATTGPRAGQDFQDFYRDGKEYHVYNGPGGRQVEAVKARGGTTVADAIMARGRQTGMVARQPDTSGQTVTDKPVLDRLAAAKLQMGTQRDSLIKRKLMGMKVR
jgi:hypothetical protein